MAFMGHGLVQVTLPHDDPGDAPVWGRENGSMSLTIQPGYYKQDGQYVSRGIPYGVYPRLVLAWITTEAVKTKSRRLKLGGSLNAFMRELGLNTAGGRTIGLLREQITRLFSASIRFNVVEEGHDQMRRVDVADAHDLWWSPGRGDQPFVAISTVLLSQSFYDAITERPVPIDMRALHVLKSSPLGLDLYMWLTYRVSYLRKETAISWDQLQGQLGSNYADTKNFARNVKRELRKIKLVWPELNVRTPRGRLVLCPSTPHVKPKVKGVLAG